MQSLPAQEHRKSHQHCDICVAQDLPLKLTVSKYTSYVCGSVDAHLLQGPLSKGLHTSLQYSGPLISHRHSSSRCCTHGVHVIAGKYQQPVFARSWGIRKPVVPPGCFLGQCLLHICDCTDPGIDVLSCSCDQGRTICEVLLSVSHECSNVTPEVQGVEFPCMLPHMSCSIRNALKWGFAAQYMTYEAACRGMLPPGPHESSMEHSCDKAIPE